MIKLLKKINLSKGSLLTFFFLFCVLALASFARFYKLETVPLGFHIDEAIIADNAYSILQTGKDTNNNFLPLQTEQFGDYNPTGLAYLAILPIKILGLTIFAARSPGAILGVLAVLGVFFLTYSVFERKNLSLLTALFVALSPWDIVLSRSSEETVSALVFVIFGFALLIWSVKKEKILYLLFATALLFISYFMYFTPRLFVPLMFLAFFIPLGYWYAKRKFIFTKLFVVSFLFLSVTSFLLVVGINGGASRFNQISIFGFPQTKLIMEEQIREDGVLSTPVPVTRFFHNKPLDYSLTFLGNYFNYFSGDFLFLKGGLPIWFNVPGMGLVYITSFPFIIYGLYWFIKEKKSWSYLFVAWLLLGPVIASLTVDDIPNVRRALVIVPAIELLAAYGVLTAIKNIPNKFKLLGIGIFVCFFSFNVLYFFHQYFIHSTIHRNWNRNEGFGEMVTAVKKDYSNYDQIVVTKSEGGIYPLILFYMKYDPKLYQKEGFSKDKTDTGFGKFFFVDNACPFLDRDPKVPKANKRIYVENGNCRSDKSLNDKKQLNIFRTDGTKVFRLVYE